MSAASARPDSSLRALLRGATGLRPRAPYARDEAEFLDRCTRCGDCIRACPESVLTHGDGGLPEFDPGRGACTFCVACADACSPRALDPQRMRAWTWRAQLGEGCLNAEGVWCMSCRDACAEAAIALAPTVPLALPRIDAARCTGCGACVSSCPASALALREVAA